MIFRALQKHLHHEILLKASATSPSGKRESEESPIKPAEHLSHSHFSPHLLQPLRTHSSPNSSLQTLSFYMTFFDSTIFHALSSTQTLHTQSK
jgi:hypothetical protein